MKNQNLPGIGEQTQRLPAPQLPKAGDPGALPASPPDRSPQPLTPRRDSIALFTGGIVKRRS